MRPLPILEVCVIFRVWKGHENLITFEFEFDFYYLLSLWDLKDVKIWKGQRLIC